MLVQFVVNAEGVEYLVGLGWLRPGAAPSEVLAAVVQLLETAFVRGLRPAL